MRLPAVVSPEMAERVVRAAFPGGATPARSPLPGTPFQTHLQDALQVEQPKSPYTVRKGDTLSHIVRDQLKQQGKSVRAAAIYDGVRELARHNGIRNPDLIRPGQPLDLSVLHDAPPAPPAPEQQIAAPAPQLEEDRVVPEIALTPVPTPEQTPAPRTEARVPDPATSLALLDKIPLPALPRGADALKAAPLIPSQPAEGGPVLPLPAANPVKKLVNRVAQTAAEKTVDLTELIQGILNPGQRSPEALPRRANPWQRTLDAPARLTSEFGRRRDPFTGHTSFHGGIDLAAKSGTKIYPFREGVVTFSGWKSGYGNVVFVQHEDGLESVYGHNAKNLVKPGEQVGPQTVLGEVGSTGRSTGPHLHFEIRKRGKAIDPVPFLTGGK